MDRVVGPKGLSRLLRSLDVDAKISVEDLARSVLGSSENEAITTVSGWMNGKVLPTEQHFMPLVRALLAWPDEEAALLRAHKRIRTVQETGSAALPESGLRVWTATRLSVCLVMATLRAVFTVCLKADPGPITNPLVWYALGAGVLSSMSWVEMISSSRHTERLAIDALGGIGIPLAVITGLLLPRFPVIELWGRWPAELVGLL
ncbi:hypothetical protein ACFVU3_31975 [Streptomyces sp. NPDC058052]|uniref:hypothetical protein n=1 Tax=Streptomyces sp. NPDC058052 TaxID=3346316 RepID=UPI0036ECBA3D